MIHSPGVTIPAIETFRKWIRDGDETVENSTETLIPLLKKRQIRGPRDCAEATALLLSRVVDAAENHDINQLMSDVRHVGTRLMSAQPRELAVGNVVRRVLGLIREEIDENRVGDLGSTKVNDGGSKGYDQDSGLLPSTENVANTEDKKTSLESHYASKEPNVVPTKTSMLSLLSHSKIGAFPSPTAAIGHAQVSSQPSSLLDKMVPDATAAEDFKSEIIEGIEELLDELRQADDQIATYALEQIHSHEIVLTNSSARTMQKFLLKASSKRKFTVILVETFPNDHETIHRASTGFKATAANSQQMHKTLTAAGLTVILVPDSAVFALMARVTKVILDANTILADGSLVTSSGGRLIAKAARMHRAPVVALGGVYKITPGYPFDVDILMENGNPSKLFQDGNDLFVETADIENPLFDYVPPALIDLYVTNVGGYAPSSLYPVVSDHYRTEDLDLKAS